VATSAETTSTFSIDVDTAAYANVRRMLQHHQRPDPESVRIEELVNYFPYDYAAPTDGRPFATHVEVTASPWKPGNRLVRVGLKGRELAQRPRSNLVFLIDVSGSMNEPQKLPLLKRSLAALVDQLREQDRVSIVVYAGASGLVLPPTTGDRKAEILGAIERLDAGGSTNGGAGMELAYKVAVQNFVDGGVNRVVLCTDGDWNVGISSKDAIEKLVVEKAKSGVFLTCLGFFGSNYKDALMERMADKGNGNYAAIDSLREAKKVLVEESAGTLCTIAKDVKIQVEFSKERVARYRLVGYENRVMANQDFRDDTKDAGEIGAGHTVTALYEVEPVPSAPAGELLTLRLRWKKPDGDVAQEQEQKVADEGRSFGSASVDTRFAAMVAGWGMLLRGSQHKGTASFAMLEELGADALGKDAAGHRREWLELVKRSRELYQPR
jgi:Ca-activated chloride channel homolog